MRPILRNTVMVVLLAIAVYSLAGFFLAPKIVVRWVKDAGEAANGMRIDIGRASVNPYSRSVTLSDITVFGPENLTFVSIGRISGIADGRSVLARKWLFRDAVVLADMRIYAAGDDAPLLEAAVAYCKGVAIESKPGRIRVDSLLISNPLVHLQRDASGTVNLPAVFRNMAGESAPVQSIELADGIADFIDHSVAPPVQAGPMKFSASLLAGGAHDARATLDVKNRESVGRLAARWQPGAAGRSFSLDVSVRNVPSQDIGAYLVSITGSRPLSGVFDIAFRANRLHDLLGITGHIVTDNVQWEAPGAGEAAQALPLAMAVALLEDNNGRVELNSGYQVNTALSDTRLAGEFVHLVTDAIAASAAEPFAAMAELAGWSGQSLARVTFEPGSAEITPASADAVRALGVAMLQRPQVGVTVWPGYDSGSDTKALAREQVKQHINLATSAALHVGGNSKPVDLDDAKVRSILDEFAENRLSTVQQALIVGESHETKRAYYRAVFDALVSNQRVDARTSARIARFRAQSIIRELRQQGIDKGRLLQSADTERHNEESAVIALKLEIWPAAHER